MPASPRSVARLAAGLLLAGSALAPATGWAWGFTTHHYIAQNYSQHLPAAMDGLRSYDGVVDAHVTDPDTRRPTTPGEEYRHYIDIDEYSEFILGVMPHDRAVLEQAYGTSFVLETGIVPWAVGEVVATLTQQFQAQNWNAAALTIADLCHYVGDTCQPLHCTRNYNGQYTGNSGIHSRYETTMMSPHIADLDTPVMLFRYYDDPVDALFGLVSGSWDKVDDLLAADNAAKAASGGSINTVYYNTLWANTQSFTRARIDSATVATASFVHTAWVNAGRPVIPGSSAGVDPALARGTYLEAGPSPFAEALNLSFGGRGPMALEVFDVRGRRVERLVDRTDVPGSLSWRPGREFGAGLYFVRLKGPDFEVIRRVTRLR